MRLPGEGIDWIDSVPFNPGTSQFSNNNFENIYFAYVNIPEIKEEMQKSSSYRRKLSDWENSYADSRKVLKRKVDFICGRLAAKEAVKYFLGKNFVLNQFKLKDIEIRRKESGEPQVYIKNKRINLSISISHSNDIAISVVSPKEINKGLGVDIEKIEDRDFSFQEIAFSQNEIDYLKSPNSSDCTFQTSNSEEITRYWAIKESVLKSLGIGLNVNPKDIEIIETINNKRDVKINNNVMDRYEKLEGSTLKVESCKIEDYMLSIACLQ